MIAVSSVAMYTITAASLLVGSAILLLVAARRSVDREASHASQSHKAVGVLLEVLRTQGSMRGRYGVASISEQPDALLWRFTREAADWDSLPPDLLTDQQIARFIAVMLSRVTMADLVADDRSESGRLVRTNSHLSVGTLRERLDEVVVLSGSLLVDYRQPPPEPLREVRQEWPR